MKTKIELESRIKFLEACCEESSKIAKKIFKAAAPYIDLPSGTTYSVDYALEQLLKRFEEFENERD